MSDGLKDRLVDAGYAAGWRLVRALPERLAHVVFRFAADLAIRRDGRGVRQLRRNLARVVPEASPAELNALVRKGMRSYARYWCESFRLPRMDAAEVHRAVEATVIGKEHVDAALAAGRGVVFALPHAGNWDAAGVWLVGRSGRFTTVAERLRPESLYWRFVAFRESLGFEIIPLTGARNPLLVLARRLRANKAVCLLADRDLTSGGVDVRFFGEPSRMPTGPAHLARSTGAALVPVGLWFTDRGWGVRFHPPIAVGPGKQGIVDATQAVADVFAAEIAEHPADWHMLQPLWLADLPPPRRRKLRAETGP